MVAARRKDHKGRVLRDGESQRKNLTYQYRFTDSLGKRHCLYAQTLDDLRRKEAEIQKKMLSGLTCVTAKPTILKLVNSYIDLKQHELRYNTICSYMTLRNIIAREPWSRLYACDIKISDSKKWIQALVAERGYSAGTVAQTKVLLASACQAAVEDNILFKNPFRFRFAKSRYERKERPYLTLAEQQSFLSFIQQDNRCSRYYNQFYVLLKTGIRIGELMGLTISDIDFSQACIQISHQVQQIHDGFCVLTPKSKSGIRILPMVDDVQKVLLEIIETNKHKEACEVDGYSNFIFTTKTGSIKRRSQYNQELAFCVRAYNDAHEKKLPPLSVHCLRHSFCTTMAELGIDPKYLQYIMGHSKIEVTMNYYRHVSYEDVQKSVLRAAGERA